MTKPSTRSYARSSLLCLARADPVGRQEILASAGATSWRQALSSRKNVQSSLVPNRNHGDRRRREFCDTAAATDQVDPRGSNAAALLMRSIERNPRHDFRKGEMAGVAARFPNPLVHLGPDFFQMLEHAQLKRPAGFAWRQSPLPRMMQCVHEFAIHIELKLGMGGVADAHRCVYRKLRFGNIGGEVRRERALK